MFTNHECTDGVTIIFFHIFTVVISLIILLLDILLLYIRFCHYTIPWWSNFSIAIHAIQVIIFFIIHFARSVTVVSLIKMI